MVPLILKNSQVIRKESGLGALSWELCVFSQLGFDLLKLRETIHPPRLTRKPMPGRGTVNLGRFQQASSVDLVRKLCRGISFHTCIFVKSFPQTVTAIIVDIGSYNSFLAKAL